MEFFPPIEADNIPVVRSGSTTPPPPSTFAKTAAWTAQIISVAMLMAAVLYVVYHAAGQYYGTETPEIITDRESLFELIVLVAGVVTVFGSALLLLWNIRFHVWATKYGKDSLPVYVIILGAVGTALTLGMPWVPLLITGINIEREGTCGGTGIRKAGLFATVFGIAAIGLSVADGHMPPLMDFAPVHGTLSLASGLAAIASFSATISASRRFMDDIRWFNRDTGTSGTFDPMKIKQKPLSAAADKGYLTNAIASRTAYTDPNAPMPGYPVGLVPTDDSPATLPLPHHMRDDQPKYISQYTFDDDDTPFATDGKISSIPVPQDAAHIVVHPRTPDPVAPAQAAPAAPAVPVAPVQPIAVPTQPAAPAQPLPAHQAPAVPVAPVQPPAAAAAPVVAPPPPAPVVEAPTPVVETPAAPAPAYVAPTILPNPLLATSPEPPAPAKPTYVAPTLLPMPDIPVLDDTSNTAAGPTTYTPPPLPKPADLPLDGEQ